MDSYASYVYYIIYVCLYISNQPDKYKNVYTVVVHCNHADNDCQHYLIVSY